MAMHKKPMMPLDYMLSVVRDETAAKARRDRLAVAAAPYCHARMADRFKGKKDRETEAADIAGTGTVWSEDLQYVDGLRQ